ncbi:uncharacterized protein [Montipora capricornis]|uniref:uncharacterized protein n=1 Tax=Montipora capricornis TaxID=246305 RepID=UPI0035F10355
MGTDQNNWENFKQPGDKQGEECEKSLNTKDALTRDNIHIDVLRCRRGSKTYRTNISWTPRLEITSNWTGYTVVYRFKNIGGKKWSPYFCRDVVGKNKTSTTVSMPNKGIKDLTQIRVSVTSLPNTSWNVGAEEDFEYLVNCTQVSETPPETLQHPVVNTPQ